MNYERINWENAPSTDTPLDADNLNKMDEALDTLNREVAKTRSDVQEVEETTASLGSQIAGIIRLEDGSTTGDAELINGRIAKDGTTYDIIGDAIRGQIGDLRDHVIEVSDEEPEEFYNKIWVNDSEDEIEIPTKAELDAVEDEVDELNERLDGELDKITSQTKNLLPAVYQKSDVRGTVAEYNFGVLTLEGAPTASGGRGIHLCPVFTLPTGTYYFSANGMSNQVTGIYVQTDVGDTIIRNGAGVFTLNAETALYIGVNIEPNIDYDELIYLQIELGGVGTDFVIPITAKDIIARTAIDEIESQIGVINDRFSIINRFDKSKAIANKYVAPGGAIGNINGYSVSDYIYIGDLDSISYCNTFRLSLYNANKTWNSDPETQNTLGFVRTIERPSNAEYMIVSYVTTNEDIVQVGENISVGQYYPYGKFRMPDLVTDDPTPENTVVYVSKSGRGAYSSLLLALMETDSDVEVLDGAYDIVAEYKAVFGNTFFDANTDRSSASDFKLGLYITNRTLKFDANTSISFDLSDNPATSVGGDDRRFSLFNLGVNAVLDGAIGTTAGNWYAIHDDGAGGDYSANYHNTIKNCVIISSGMVNSNSIGGGFGRYSETDIDNCYFNNGADASSYTIRYHNTWNGQAQPVCHVKNTYCNAKIGFWKYGQSPKVGTCTVCNCSMIGTADLNIIGEATDNLQILQWANDNRAS